MDEKKKSLKDTQKELETKARVEKILSRPRAELIAEKKKSEEEDKKLTEEELAMKYGVGEEDL